MAATLSTVMFKGTLSRAGKPARLLSCAVFAVLLAGIAVGPARAGFEWTPPSPAEPLPEPPNLGRPTGLAPAGADTAAVNGGAMPAGDVMREELGAPTSLSPDGSSGNGSAAGAAYSVGAPYAPPSYPPSPYALHEGFGADIPLGLALPRIVPPGFNVTIADNVDTSVPVSWAGQKPWDQTLNEALSPKGLRADVDPNGTVRVYRADFANAGPGLAPAPSPAMQGAERATYAMPPAQGGSVMRTISPNAPQSRSQFPGQSSAVPPGAPTSIMPLPAPMMPSSYEPDILVPTRAAPASFQGFAGNPAFRPVEPPIPNASVFAASPGRVLDPRDIRYWQASSGESLKTVLRRWSEIAGVTLYWGASDKYILPSSVNAHGTYTDLVENLLQGYEMREGQRPVGRLHPNLPQGPSVLIIQDYPEN